MLIDEEEARRLAVEAISRIQAQSYMDLSLVDDAAGLQGLQGGQPEVTLT